MIREELEEEEKHVAMGVGIREIRQVTGEEVGKI